jgi:predicted branched-subunit amino acid permease
MLLTLSCLTAQLVALATWLFARGAGIPAGRPNALLLVPTTLMMVALITGILLVIVTPVVYRVRKSRPPIVITIAALVIALAPLFAIAVVALIG